MPLVSPTTFQEIARSLGPQIDAALTARLALGEGCPIRLREAMHYSLLAPGKRLRPMLVLMAAEACGGSIEAAMPAACAVEMVHAYSLIHDDLPAMDDDDLRRGRPTCHKAFDEATAILAGDGLLTLAFEVLAAEIQPPATAAACCAALAQAAGPCNMVGGQADDVEAERSGFRVQGSEEVASGQWSVASKEGSEVRGQGGLKGKETVASETNPKSPNPQIPKSLVANHKSEIINHKSLAPRPQSPLSSLKSIHRRKTGAMIQVSLRLGGLTAGATTDQITALDDYGRRLGLAFQITDDLLDVQSTEAVTGKRVGKDAQRGKLTFPGLLGIEQSAQQAEQLISEACQALAPFGPQAERLQTLARYVLERNH